MKIFQKKFKAYPIGVWWALFALLLIFFAWSMQLYSLLNWEAAVKLGLQNESFNGSQTERAIADIERGIAIADIIWVLPLTIVAFIGLLRFKFIGFMAAQMVFAICVYFPLFYAFRESMDNAIILVAFSLWAIPSLLAIASLWVNKKRFFK